MPESPDTREMTKDTFLKMLDEEISQAKKSSFWYGFADHSVFYLTVFTGGITTLLSAINFENVYLIAILAFVTTALGTISSQTDFKKKHIGYRKTKTELQDLWIDAKAHKGETVDGSFVDELKKIRNQKVLRTSIDE
jgi:hypothetical protein